jgi:hypothetical protein
MALPPKSVRARADQTLAASRSAGCDETIFVAHDKILKRTAAIVWPGSMTFKRDFAPCRRLNWLNFGVPLKIAGLKTCRGGQGLQPGKVGNRQRSGLPGHRCTAASRWRMG